MAQDRYRYFRIEARELLDGLGRGFLDLDRGGPSRETVQQLLRLAHTLKGSSHVVGLTEVGKLAHQMEDRLSGHRQSDEPVPRAVIEGLQGLLDRIGERVAAIDRPAGEVGQPRASVAGTDQEFESVRVEIAELDNLLESVSEVAVEAGELRSDCEPLAPLCADAAKLVHLLEEAGRSAHPPGKGLALAETVRDEIGAARRRIFANLDALERQLDAVRTQVDRIRLVPAQALFSDMERAARDLAADLGKRVDIALAGGDVRLDAHVLAGVRSALVHVVRNAVAHGIEEKSERAAANKPPEGRLALRVERRGHRVTFRCEDDGRGIGHEGVRRALVQQGRLSESQAAALTAEGLAKELLRGGLTTRESATQAAGRGVGLDAARSAVERLKGSVALRSRPECGTVVELSVPVSLSALPTLRVEGGANTAVISLDSVRASLRVEEKDLTRSADGAALAIDGQVLPFLPLAEILGTASPAGRVRTALVVEARGQRAVIGVERLGGIESVVVRKVPEAAKVDPVVAGIALDRRGRPQVVLEPDALVQTATTKRAAAPAAAPAPRLPVLVIDDSLTTRMLEKSILESAGYEVDLAVSGEEALVKARERRYGVFIVDVEMPGMNGFEFVSRTRADAQLREVPAIIVTSLGDAEDRRRGKESGARAYIVKGEFDQGALLEAVRRLAG